MNQTVETRNSDAALLQSIDKYKTLQCFRTQCGFKKMRPLRLDFLSMKFHNQSFCPFSDKKCWGIVAKTKHIVAI